MRSRTIPRAAWLALTLLSPTWAQDAIFGKSALMGASGAKTTPIDLVVSNSGVTIRSKDKTPSVILDLPYSSITNLGYSFTDRGRAWLLPVMGAAALFLKGQSHWLVIESSGKAPNATTVLRLDKTEYREVVAALTARSGKRVEMLAPGSTLVDPTVGSHDEDQTVPFPIDQVRAAIKLANSRRANAGADQDRKRPWPELVIAGLSGNAPIAPGCSLNRELLADGTRRPSAPRRSIRSALPPTGSGAAGLPAR